MEGICGKGWQGGGRQKEKENEYYIILYYIIYIYIYYIIKFIYKYLFIYLFIE